jgi:hypothetical protein
MDAKTNEVESETTGLSNGISPPTASNSFGYDRVDAIHGLGHYFRHFLF